MALDRILPGLPFSLPELPDIGDFTSLVDTIDTACPKYLSSTITFTSACLITAQIAMGILMGTASFSLMNIVILTGCWLGYKYVNDQTYLDRLQQTADSYRAIAEEQQNLVRKREAQLEKSRLNIVKLEEQTDRLQKALDNEQQLNSEYKTKVDQSILQGETLKKLIQKKDALVAKQGLQIEKLSQLVESSRCPTKGSSVQAETSSTVKLPVITSVFKDSAGQELLNLMSQLRVVMV